MDICPFDEYLLPASAVYLEGLFRMENDLNENFENNITNYNEINDNVCSNIYIIKYFLAIQNKSIEIKDFELQHSF